MSATTAIVVVESPFRAREKWIADVYLAYARACVRHCILRGESPFASHLLYTQPGILRDEVPVERGLGIGCGWDIGRRADRIAFYLDFGESQGMRETRVFYSAALKPIEDRFLPPDLLRPVMLLIPKHRRGQVFQHARKG